LNVYKKITSLLFVGSILFITGCGTDDSSSVGAKNFDSEIFSSEIARQAHRDDDGTSSSSSFSIASIEIDQDTRLAQKETDLSIIFQIASVLNEHAVQLTASLGDRFTTFIGNQVRTIAGEQTLSAIKFISGQFITVTSFLGNQINSSVNYGISAVLGDNMPAQLQPRKFTVPEYLKGPTPPPESTTASDIEKAVEKGTDSFAEEIGKDFIKGQVVGGLNSILKLTTSAIFGIQNPYMTALSGIENELTQISNTLNQVYNNTQSIIQEQKIQDNVSSIAYFQSATEFQKINSELIDFIDGQNSFNTQFNAFYEALYDKYYNADTNTTNYSAMCDVSSDTFIRTYFNNINDNGLNLIGLTSNMLTDLASTNDNSNDYTDMMNALLTLTGQDLVTGYHFVGSQLANQISTTGNLLLKAHFVLNFVLYASNQCPDINSYIANGGVDHFHSLYGFGASTFKTIDNNYTALSNAITSLDTTFNTQYVIPNVNNLSQLLSGSFENGDIYQALFSRLNNFNKPLSFTSSTFSPEINATTCVPLHYSTRYPTDNMNYFAADCLNGDGSSSVYQLYIPTSSDSPGLVNIDFLQGFGLIGDINYTTIQPLVGGAGWLSSHATQEYMRDKTTGSFSSFCSSSNTNPDFCVPQWASIQTANSLYGLGLTDFNNNFTKQVGFAQRYYFSIPYPADNGYTSTSDIAPQNMLFLTTNGHLFYGGVTGQTKYTSKYASSHGRNRKASLGFGIQYPGGSQSDVAINGNLGISTGDDGTEVYSSSCSSCVAVNNDGDSSKWQWGWGMQVGNTPQPNASDLNISEDLFDHLDYIFQ